MHELKFAIALYQNDFSPSRVYAEAALRDDRPAFWSTTKHHAAIVNEMMDSLNTTGSLEGSIGRFPPHRRQMAIDSITRLLPLNEKAEDIIDQAYEAYEFS